MTAARRLLGTDRPPRRYLVKPAPIHFPEDELAPESQRHLRVRTALFQMLEAAFGDRASVGSDQFVYWDAQNPKVCCSPDVVLRFCEPDRDFGSWKVWERGAPELAIELESRHDTNIVASWAKRLERYRQLGVLELVRFNLDRGTLRIWDRASGALIERDPSGPGFSQSDVLPGYWLVRQDSDGRPWLRLAHDERGEKLYPTPAERLEQSEQRVRELEAALAEARKR